MNPSRHNQNKGQRLSLIGAMIEDKVARGELPPEQFAADMDAYLQHPLDRSLFGLPEIKVENVRGDGEASPEQKTIRHFYGFSALALIVLLAGVRDNYCPNAQGTVAVTTEREQLSHHFPAI